MNTIELLSVLPVKTIIGTVPETVTDLAVDSRAVQDGGAFVCLKGYTVNGHQFVKNALLSGARLIIASEPITVDEERTAVVYVEDSSKAIHLLASKFYGYPSKQMKMIGVTGTNGKTSVGNIIHDMLRQSGEETAVSGTIGFKLNDILYETENTTTDVLTTQQMIAQAANEGCKSMTMEVSSHGLIEGRLAGTEFDIAVFTNLTHDHLDYHKTMENYSAAKALLFAQLGQQLDQQKFAVVNADDPWSSKMTEVTSFPVLTYGIRVKAAFQATSINMFSDRTEFVLLAPDGTYPVTMPLIGEFNVYNALAAVAALYAKGMTCEEILPLLAGISTVKGRLEKVETSLPLTIFIDYAHSPDAIEKAIATVEPLKKDGKRLLFLIGTGGNRDRLKRPIMGEKAAAADYVVFTTDDPRDEPYESIVSELSASMPHDQYACIGDREEAVRHTIEMANEGDIIIFAGKGHEDYQIIGHTKYPHSDADIALDEARKKFGGTSVNS
ncbi:MULTISPECIES: UDP-N-acetylmuramoyl-L-alanyl-D-glutamate--2,6-diaminopimelate ligase [unclassified Sporosarcina]|uniref:UDP-N-acetylmuramoyl-L-alanyl-D-glutamate--2, 6-diaminopimelate ligase n=1 Tax=unclassified Sporosarcina TaxID=2647733 RepID=UPI00203E775A|nr:MULTISPECIES: UDP-N-acetylmuramoyl-L-alanyl-D-glutamate--2,6-diaminopimelate ligase [unclassified Sporosarcina]GKV66023.1 UDP-N-acetylmuramoyl-L-alanyl-D-glutamate--L-lysi ne ligase [Sporosarcina sp. NCCP-2331]GLB56551.1 UDP-N-acetylmuramoyl-L-alanyl-D-glutamate--L-lysi ne ligase [Sporosarcina sp. NCCP-2378]